MSFRKEKSLETKILLSPVDTYVIAKHINTIPPQAYYQVFGLQDNASVEDIAVAIKNLTVIFDVARDGASDTIKEDIKNAQKALKDATKHAKGKHRTLSNTIENLHAASEFQHPVGIKYRETH
ncbi:hypothetical protein TEQG_07161 [Trichophyton equinum CBS 127.97]|uniref:Uncharacterized protein n=1 Tax=Trichophyton equinum (strain ATCC MYA-4606 / CBS 127.97) TaxID=559882 RepID=F2Q267_TRIEC|nr:hypothetical protein TEQG_07161 [Trichophyton equinum CBS 127.97]